MGNAENKSLVGNLNTLLLSVVLMLSAWTLKTVYDMSNALTAVTTRVDGHDRSFNAIDARVTANEREITNIRVRAGRPMVP